MIVALLFLIAGPPGAEAFANQAVGLSTSAEQSEDERYDFVASETWRIDPYNDGDVWLYQQNWIIGEEAQRDAARKIRSRHDAPPYFQVAIRFRDFGDGEVHTTTYRITNEARSAARAFAAEPGASFDAEWLGEVACMGKLRSVGEGYWHGKASCPNGYKGGVKVESRSIRSPTGAVNWDRGYDTAGQHIWGPADGGYIFKSWEGR